MREINAKRDNDDLLHRESTMFDHNNQSSAKKQTRSPSKLQDDPIEYQISPAKMNGIRKNVLSINMRDSSPKHGSGGGSPEKTTFGNN
jgi:hypothetical protein